MDNLTIYDKTELYKEEIAPLVAEIRKICAINNLPFFFSCPVSNDDKGTVYKTTGHMTGAANIELKDDLFRKYMLLIRGAKLKSLIPGIDSDDEVFENFVLRNDDTSEIWDADELGEYMEFTEDDLIEENVPVESTVIDNDLDHLFIGDL